MNIFFVILREYRKKDLHGNMISFFIHDIVFIFKQKNRFKRWLNELASMYEKRLCRLNIIFCSDSFLLNLNREFLGHNYCTDVISFDHSLLYSKTKISGDIYISVDTVKLNAAFYKVSFEDELLRVMAHGLLHLFGFKDINDNDRAIMLCQEEAAILRFKEGNQGTLCSKQT